MIIARLPSWSNCIVEIKDIGEHSFWGFLFDAKENLLINDSFVGEQHDPWIYQIVPDVIFSTQN